MNVLEAIAQVLKEAGAPLHTRDITDRILKQELWSSAGKTPQQTVAARLYSDVKRKGRTSRFVLAGPQVFSLRTAGPTDSAEPAIARDSSTPTDNSYSFTNAAQKILERFGDARPMHYRAITKVALEQGWLKTEGKTPESTMYAQILTEIRRYQKRGEQPRFVQHGKGFVGLSRWMGKGLGFEIEQHNRKIRHQLLKRLLEMKWQDFEELVARLLAAMDFEEVQMRGRRNDGGIDVRATLVVGDTIRTRMAVQVKKWKHNVQSPVVQQVRGSRGAHEYGLIITTSDFSAGARAEASRADADPVGLINGERFATLLAEHGIGVVRRSHTIFELTEELSPSSNSEAPVEVTG